MEMSILMDLDFLRYTIYKLVLYYLTQMEVKQVELPVKNGVSLNCGCHSSIILNVIMLHPSFSTIAGIV